MSRVTPPDLELFLTGYVRGLGALLMPPPLVPPVVSNKEPAGVFPPSMVIVRDDSGPKTSVITFDRLIGFSVLSGTKTYDLPANDLARALFSYVTSDDIVHAPGSPIASVDSARGPWAVSEPQDKARRYFVVGYSVVGAPGG